MPDKIDLREDLFIFYPQFQEIHLIVVGVSGESWCQETETAGHTASTVRKQREKDAGTHLIFPFQEAQELRSPAQGLVLPIFRVVLPASINLDTPSKTGSKLCFHGDPNHGKSYHVSHHIQEWAFIWNEDLHRCTYPKPLG